MDPNATETKAPETIAAQETTEGQPSLPADQDLLAKYQQLEEEKAKALEVGDNYKNAYLKLKEKVKNRAPELDEDEDERIRRIAREEMAESQLVAIAQEQQSILERALRENQELKLAQLSKPDVPVALGSHGESAPVRDTLVTPEQESYFRDTLKWSDEDVARYKRHLLKSR